MLVVICSFSTIPVEEPLSFRSLKHEAAVDYSNRRRYHSDHSRCNLSTRAIRRRKTSQKPTVRYPILVASSERCTTTCGWVRPREYFSRSKTTLRIVSRTFSASSRRRRATLTAWTRLDQAHKALTRTGTPWHDQRVQWRSLPCKYSPSLSFSKSAHRSSNRSLQHPSIESQCPSKCKHHSNRRWYSKPLLQSMQRHSSSSSKSNWSLPSLSLKSSVRSPSRSENEL